jgi:hypothetical protein
MREDGDAPMSDVVNFQISLESDLGRELVADCAKFSEGILDERQVRKKYRFDDDAWEALGSNDQLVEKIEAEKIRRIRDGSAKREKSQMLITKAPGILDGIMSDASASPRHRVDAIRTLDGFAANGPAGAPASDRFIITINLGADHIERYSKSLKSDVNDVDPFTDVDTGVIAAIAAKKITESGGGEPV